MVPTNIERWALVPHVSRTDTRALSGVPAEEAPAPGCRSGVERTRW